MNSESKALSTDEKLEGLLKKHPGEITSMQQPISAEKLLNFSRHFSFGEVSVAFFNLNHDRVVVYNSIHNDYLSQPAVCPDVLGNRHHINRLTHANDVEFWSETHLLTYKNMMELPPEERAGFKVVGSRRLLENDGNYHSYLHYISPFEFDDANCPLSMIIQTKRVNMEGFPQFRHFNRCPGSYTEVHAFSANVLSLKLSPRVEETLNRYSKGEIGKKTAGNMKINIKTLKEYIKIIRDEMGVDSIKIAGVIWKIKIG